MSAMRNYLGIDLGTTSFKAGLFDENGHTVAMERQPSAFVRSPDGHVELTVDEFESEIERLLRVVALAAPMGLSSVAAISFASQANTFACLDAGGGALTPLISWTDGRAGATVDDPLNRLANMREVTGVPAIDGEFAVAKLRWIAAHQPAVMAATRQIGFVDSLVVRWLTGELATEASLAAITGLADARHAVWWDSAVRTLLLPKVGWPAIARAGMPIGVIRSEVSDRLGLPRSVIVVAGCLDQCAAAIGTGTVRAGDVCETTGTVLSAIRVSDAFEAGEGVLTCPAFDPQRFFHMTFSSTSANLLDAYRSLVASTCSHEALIARAAASSSGVKIGRVESADQVSLMFLPDILARPEGTVVRGILDRVNEELAMLVGMLGTKPKSIRSAGGGAKSDVWLQLKADRLGVRIIATAAAEPACLGAAMLAASGAGLATIDELAARWCRVRAVFEPSASAGMEAVRVRA